MYMPVSMKYYNNCTLWICYYDNLVIEDDSLKSTLTFLKSLPMIQILAQILLLLN